MGEVVNLRLQRKRAARRAAEDTAADRRLRFGLPKALRRSAEREAASAAARLDGHRLTAETRADAADDDIGPNAPADPWDDAR